MAVDLTITINSNLQNSLTWVDNTTFGNGGYHVERSADAGNIWVRVEVADSGVFTTIDSGIDNATFDYYYRVSAIPRPTGIGGTQGMEAIFPGQDDGAILPEGIPGLWFWGNGTEHGSTMGTGVCLGVDTWLDRSSNPSGELRDDTMDWLSDPGSAPGQGSGLGSGIGCGVGGANHGGAGANGHRYLNFDGTNALQSYGLLSLSSGTLVFVIRPNSLAVAADLNLMSPSGDGTSPGSQAGPLCFGPTAGAFDGLGVYTGAAWLQLIAASNITTTDFNVISVKFDEGGTATAYYGQTEAFSVSSDFDYQDEAWNLGGKWGGITHNNFAGEIAEMLIFDHPLSDVYLNLLQEHLLVKYDL